MDNDKLFINNYIDALEEHLKKHNPDRAEELKIHSLVVHDLIEGLCKLRKLSLNHLRNYDLMVAAYIENGELRK